MLGLRNKRKQVSPKIPRVELDGNVSGKSIPPHHNSFNLSYYGPRSLLQRCIRPISRWGNPVCDSGAFRSRRTESREGGRKIMRSGRTENYAIRTDRKFCEKYVILCDIMRKVCDIFWSTGGIWKNSESEKRFSPFSHHLELNVQTSSNSQK